MLALTSRRALRLAAAGLALGQGGSGGEGEETEEGEEEFHVIKLNC